MVGSYRDLASSYLTRSAEMSQSFLPTSGSLDSLELSIILKSEECFPVKPNTYLFNMQRRVRYRIRESERKEDREKEKERERESVTEAERDKVESTIRNITEGD